MKSLHAKLGELTVENDFCPLRSANAHRLDGVDDQVEDDLFELDLISCDERQAIRELRRHRDAVLQCFAMGEFNHLADRFVDLQAIVP